MHLHLKHFFFLLLIITLSLACILPASAKEYDSLIQYEYQSEDEGAPNLSDCISYPQIVSNFDGIQITFEEIMADNAYFITAMSWELKEEGAVCAPFLSVGMPFEERVDKYPEVPTYHVYIDVFVSVEGGNPSRDAALRYRQLTETKYCTTLIGGYSSLSVFPEQEATFTIRIQVYRVFNGEIELQETTYTYDYTLLPCSDYAVFHGELSDEEQNILISDIYIWSTPMGRYVWKNYVPLSSDQKTKCIVYALNLDRIPLTSENDNAIPDLFYVCLVNDETRKPEVYFLMEREDHEYHLVKKYSRPT